MKVFITGIKGFIGSHVASRLHALGFSVYGSVSAETKLTSKPETVENLRLIRLGKDFDEAMFEGMDAIVHCAYDSQSDSKERNVEGTMKISQAAARRKVPFQVFISSCSARPDAMSEYGQVKYELERYFIREGHAVVRPGLVIGPGGLFLRMLRMIQRFPVLPLPDGAHTPVPVIGIKDMVDCLVLILETKKTGAYNLYKREQPTLRDILSKVREVLGSRTIFLTIPSVMLVLPLLVVQKMGIHLSVTIENLRGYQVGRSMKDKSDLNLFLSKETSLKDMIQGCFLKT